MKKFTKDRQLGVVCLAITAFIVWQCSQIKIRKAQFEVIGPRTFPLIAAGVFAICGIALLLRKPKGPDKVYMTKQEFLRALVMFGCYIIYLAGLYFLGLKFAAPITLFVMGLLFGKGKAKWWQILIYSVIFSVVFYCLYVYAFQIRVPQGILF